MEKKKTNKEKKTKEMAVEKKLGKEKNLMQNFSLVPQKTCSRSEDKKEKKRGRAKRWDINTNNTISM